MPLGSQRPLINVASLARTPKHGELQGEGGRIQPGLEYPHGGKVEDAGELTNCATAPPGVMNNADTTAERKSPYALSILAKCVRITGAEFFDMNVNAGVAAAPATIWVRMILDTRTSEGAAFVTHQLWCSFMFAPNAIGTAKCQGCMGNSGKW